jgi:spermidine synthase
MRPLVAALVTGLAAFISLSYEILWYRMLGFVSGDPGSTFGLLLAFYLAGLAGGALGVGALCRRGGPPSGHPPWIGVALFIGVANVLGYSVGPLLGWLAQRGLWPLALPLVTISAAGLGAILPLMSHYAVSPDERAGAGLSYMYAVNILGSAAGSLLTGYVLLDVLPLHRAALLFALFGLGIAALVALQSSPHTVRARGVAVMLLVAAGAVTLVNERAFDALYEKLLYKDQFRPGTRFARVVENRVGVVAVTQRAEVFGGGVYDGMILTDPVEDRNGILRAYAVEGMRAHPRRILVIGMSTGAWAQVLAHAPGLEEMTLVEINPGYLQIIKQYAAVASLLENPKVRIVIDDGRRWLRRNPEERFDFIVLNTTFNWRSHITNLLSAEFLQLIRQHLNPGGIYYFNTTDSPQAAKTAFTVFPHGLRFRNFVAVSDSPFELDRFRWTNALAEWRIDGRRVLDINREADRRRLASLDSETTMGAGFDAVLEGRESALARLQRARVITDDNMATEWERVFPMQWRP